VASADVAVVAAILGVCCHHQSRCVDQIEHVASGTVTALCVSILTPYRQVGYRILFVPRMGKTFSLLERSGPAVGPSQLPDL